MVGCKSPFFSALVLAITKPLGVFMARVFARERTFMDPFTAAFGKIDLPTHRSGRKARDGVDRICDCSPDVQCGPMVGLYRSLRVQQFLPLNPQEIRPSRTRTRL